MLNRAFLLILMTSVFAWHGQANSQSYPVCVSASSDPDGDGFGWENNQTCTVSAQASASAEQSLPVCASASSDVDGDGFGWENNQSCIVSASVQNNSAQTSFDTGQTSECLDFGTFPWGWNPVELVSCRLDSEAQAVQQAQVDTPVQVQTVEAPIAPVVQSTPERQPQPINLAGSLPYPQRSGFDIKSLTTDFWPDRQELLNANISGVHVNLVWEHWQPSLTGNCSGGQTRFEGQCFTINSVLDSSIKFWSDQGKTVTGILIGIPEWARANTGCTAGIFCTAQDSADYARFAAMLAQRYNGQNGNGRIVDFVIHNEVNMNQWYNIGCGGGTACNQQRWISDYAQNFNAAYDRITAIQPAARVLIPFAHFFETTFDNPNGSTPIISVKTFLRGVHALAGGRKWRIAYHPYHQRLDSAESSYDDLPYVTFGNIGVIAGWLRQEFPFQPESWEIHLTENGVSSNGSSNEFSQDFAVCNSFRNVLGTPGIENYVYHRMQDHPLEANEGAAFGLRRSNGSAKPAWATWSTMSGRGNQRNGLDCGFEHLPYTRLVSFVDNRGNYRASTRVVDSSYTEVNDWYLLREFENDTRMAYECRNGAGSYVSADVNCGGALSYGPLGYVHNASASGRVPLLSCVSGDRIYATSDNNCGNDQLREFIGYVKPDR